MSDYFNETQKPPTYNGCPHFMISSVEQSLLFQVHLHSEYTSGNWSERETYRIVSDVWRNDNLEWLKVESEWTDC